MHPYCYCEPPQAVKQSQNKRLQRLPRRPDLVVAPRNDTLFFTVAYLCNWSSTSCPLRQTDAGTI